MMTTKLAELEEKCEILSPKNLTLVERIQRDALDNENPGDSVKADDDEEQALEVVGPGGEQVPISNEGQDTIFEDQLEIDAPENQPDEGPSTSQGDETGKEIDKDVAWSVKVQREKVVSQPSTGARTRFHKRLSNKKISIDTKRKSKEMLEEDIPEETAKTSKSKQRKMKEISMT
ncbi:hypothetical protein HAX54_004939 [Datura stramonium]|uniref:Uncharacterized protein n=1 Tax=Datura stramonium TaxID=4076 RepID=A0ABS8WVK7_DATST|nr:hypothetical protein [Datura stramonium]